VFFLRVFRLLVPQTPWIYLPPLGFVHAEIAPWPPQQDMLAQRGVRPITAKTAKDPKDGKRRQKTPIETVFTLHVENKS